MCALRQRRAVIGALACLLTALARPLVGQTFPPPGRAHLFVLDLAGTPAGEFPTTIKQLKGSMEVALKDGVPMLKASVTSEFLITLPQGQVLPPDFTLEFDLVPKACCNPSDLSFEGTPTINQGAGSAHVLWDSDGYLAIIGGGGDTYEAPMWEDFRTLLPGVLTRVVAVVQGPTIRLYTNGRRHYTLDKQFVRGRVLRVTLGVDLARQDPVHLAGLRILAGAFPPTIGTPVTPVLASPPSGSITPMSPPPPTPVTVLPAVPPPASITPMTPPQPPTVAGPATLTVANRSGWGAALQWSEVVGATGYQVDRSVNGGAFMLFAAVDAKAQPAVAGLHSSEDVTVQPGTRYQYRVIAQFAMGPASAHSPTATFDAPAVIAQVSNFGLSQIHPPTDGKSLLRWDWTPIPTALTYEIEIEVQERSPPHASLWKSQLSVFAIDAPPFYAHADAGKRVRLCVSLVRAASPGLSLPYAVCRTEDLP